MEGSAAKVSSSSVVPSCDPIRINLTQSQQLNCPSFCAIKYHQAQESMDISVPDTPLQKRIPQIDTKIGTIGVLSFNEDIPAGWQRLQLEEAQPYLEEMKRMMTQWSIIAFQFHKYHGPGYKYQINQGYGTECGQGWILKRKPALV